MSTVNSTVVSWQLLHLQTNTVFDLPSNLATIHIGKLNEQHLPDIDVSSLPDADIASRIHAEIQLDGSNYFQG